LASELPVDEYRVAAVLHPNIRAGHGPGQLELWLDRARRAGLSLVDPLAGWRQALIAADLVIGDFGSVSYYAAACGTPVLLGAGSPDDLGPASPVAEFVRTTPRLDPYAPLLPQLERESATHRPRPALAELATSSPGRSAELLRRLFYDLIGIPEPAGSALLDPLPLPPYEPAAHTAPLRVISGTEQDGVLRIRRFAEPGTAPDGPGSEHLAVHEDTLDQGVLDLADIIWRYGDADDPRLGPPGRWAAEVLDRHPGCSLAAYVTGPRTCTVRHRSGVLVELAELHAGPAESAPPPGADPTLYASAFLAHLAHLGTAANALPATGVFTVRTGAVLHRVRSRLLGGPAAQPEPVEIGEVDGGVLPAQQHGGLVDQP
jgi:hypothetical protein